MNLRKYILPMITMLSFPAIGQQQVGSTHPNAAVLTFKSGAPVMNDFSEGLAVLQDGEVFSVIDNKGKTTIPYTKYNSVSPFKNGYARVQNSTYKEAFMDSKGKLITPFGGALPNSDVDAEGYYVVDWITLKRVSGELIKFPAPAKRDTFSYSFNFHEGLCRFGTPRSQGYVNRKGGIVIKPQFKDASDFSEGLAAVQRTSHVGDLKWGFVDTSGKTIIPFQFSSRPGDFSNGLSHVVTRDGQHR